MNKKIKLKVQKTNNGITLVALIITIIIILILAVVTLNVLKRDGIIGYAKNAKDTYIKESKRENKMIEQLMEEIEGEGTVKLKPDPEKKVAETSFSRKYGTIDVIWLKDTGNTVTTKPNSPALFALNNKQEKLTPVKFEGNIWVTTEATDSSWYHYTAGKTEREEGSKLTDNLLSQWANAKTANESYFVWIPRFAYRITYYESETSTVPTGYCDGYGMWDAKEETINYALNPGIEKVIYKGKTYIVHPAFTKNLDNGGWDNNLSGFWFAKYETSVTDAKELMSTNGVESQITQNIGLQYLSARQAKFGYSGTIDVDNYSSFMHSHMVKNSEWGAVAYLTHSQYGRNGNKITTNTSNLTGGGTDTSFITNVQQSTTGNVYGIYDMSGGKYEYTASFDKTGDSTYVAGEEYGKNMTDEAKQGDTNYVSTKYITVYENDTEIYKAQKVYEVSKIGDAIKENLASMSRNECMVFRLCICLLFYESIFCKRRSKW